MSQKPLVCTISKFPPYMSGHSFEAMNQGRGLCELTGYKHYEVTYDSSLYDKSVNFNDSPDLLKYSKKYLNVSRIKASKITNSKVVEGELTKAFMGEIIHLLEKKDINVISTFYLDPHAYIANFAQSYAKKILKRKIITAHKAVGSDVLNSIGNHLDNGQGKFLLNEFICGDLIFAVSEFTRKKINEYGKKLLPAKSAEELASRLKVLYPPFENEYFAMRDEDQIEDLKKRFKIPPDFKIISYFGRLFPEKGINDLLKSFVKVKQSYPKIFLLIGGYGVEMNKLKSQARDLGLKDYKFTGAVSDHEKKAIMQMSFLGVIPTKPIDNFVETLCISALEYQASGCVLLTTRVGGVPEAGGEHSLYAKHSDPEDLAKKMVQVLSGKINREEIISKGLKHVAKFNYKKITSEFLELVNEKLNG
jgi:glycosyltransferase involved in cell wall biosynthesis